MAQNYTEQLRKDNVRDAIYEDLQNNCEVLRTSWSGNAFPANPKVGQPCYRVDEDKLYYWDGYKWSQKGGGGSAELKTMELAAATSERVSITLEGARCLDKNMMFVFVDKIAQDPSTYSMNDDGTVVNFNPAIPANAAVTLRWFDTDVGTFDTAIFASDAEFAAGELTNKAPNVKQVHSLSDQIQTSNANYVKSELQSNLLNYTTNRILEIPQDIKLELNNGTLTLKAGSKVYVPNGFEADGTTPKFDTVITSNDTTLTVNPDNLLSCFYTNIGLSYNATTFQVFSGGTAPTGQTYMTWYDTTNNIIKMTTDGGSTWVSHNASFPLCILSSKSVIDQVFNGFGYIGLTVFALPGVKVQIPDGRNENGTCKSVYGTIRTVQQTSINPGNGDFSIRIGDNYIAVSKFVYDEETNYNYNQTVSPSNKRYQTNAGTVSYSSGKITSFTPYTVDSVLNSSLSNLSAAGQAKFDAKANVSNTVTTDTAQTISGSKRFTKPSAGMSIELVADTNQQTIPSTTTIRQLVLYRNSTYTKGDGYTSLLQGYRGSEGWTTTEIYARRFLEGDSQLIINYIKVGITPDGIPISYTKTPPANSAGEEIVTAGWVNSKMQVVSALPANPDPNVFYFIPE